MTKSENIIGQFETALRRLEKALAKPKDEFMRDSVIQRFEFTFDLSWKAVKSYLETQKGLVCRSPKDCLRLAYQEKLIEYDKFWLDMVDDRNELAHTYKEEVAEKVYDLMPEIVDHFINLLAGLKK